MSDTAPKEICLYRCWTQNVNGTPQKLQACYPGNGGGHTCTEKDIGENVDPILKSADGQCYKYQVIRCKFPHCLS